MSFAFAQLSKRQISTNRRLNMPNVAAKLNLSQVGRVCVTVADTDRAIDFYVGTLGFEKVVDVPMGESMRWVEVAARRNADDDRPRSAAAGPGGRRQPDGHLPRHLGRRCRPRRAQGQWRRRGRRGHPLGRPCTADVLVARPGRELADHRSAFRLVALSRRSKRGRTAQLVRGSPASRIRRAAKGGFR